MKTLRKKVVKNLTSIISDIVTEITLDTELTNLFLEEGKKYFIKESYSYTPQELKKLFYTELKNEKLGNNRFIGCLAMAYYKMVKQSKDVTIISPLTIPSDLSLELLI